MTAIKFIYGPVDYGTSLQVGSISNFSPVSLNDQYAQFYYKLDLRRSGTITDIGFYHVSTVGSPPDYNVSIQTVTWDSGYTGSMPRIPSGIMYGGSTITAFTPNTVGWKWVTLDAPVTAVEGDQIAAVLEVSAILPDASNYITVAYSLIWQGGHGLHYFKDYVGYRLGIDLWGNRGNSHFAIRFSDGEVVGIPVIALLPIPSITSSTSPDEVGAKFTVPFNCVIDGVVLTNNAGIATGTVNLYDEFDTVLRTFNITSSMDINSREWKAVFEPIALYNNQDYRFTFAANSASPYVLLGFQYVDPLLKYTLPNGLQFSYTSRTNGGAWTDDDTILPRVGLSVTDFSFPIAPFVPDTIVTASGAYINSVLAGNRNVSASAIYANSILAGNRKISASAIYVASDEGFIFPVIPTIDNIGVTASGSYVNSVLIGYRNITASGIYANSIAIGNRNVTASGIYANSVLVGNRNITASGIYINSIKSSNRIVSASGIYVITSTNFDLECI